jgi:hypothetical protein
MELEIIYLVTARAAVRCAGWGTASEHGPHFHHPAMTKSPLYITKSVTLCFEFESLTQLGLHGDEVKFKPLHLVRVNTARHMHQAAEHASSYSTTVIHTWSHELA